MAIKRLKAVSVYSGEHCGHVAFVGFVTVGLNFMVMINSKKNAKRCNSLGFLTAKYSYTCANRSD